MSLAATLRRLRRLPPREVLRRGAGRVRRGAGTLRQRATDALLSTYSPRAEVPAGPLFRYLGPLPLDVLRPRADELARVCERFLEHRFNLLGSGWVRVRHGTRVAGVEGHVYPAGAEVRADPEGAWLAGRINRANLAESRRIWRLIGDPAYVPVDWQLDFKSGYRWREDIWGRAVPYGHLPGVDVKVPWELSRMQHLPQLACAYALTGAEEYAREFRRQVLDFLATNPPRYGVNWSLAMDVAIRAVSWAVAYDLFRAHGATFDTEFERELTRGLLDHGRYVFRYLEWSPEARGNHYLADVAGLLVVAAYLPRTPETGGWLAFAVRELAAETALQFTPDGGSFESSTCYHRLSAEMVAYATAFVLALPEERWAPLLPPEHFAQLERMAELMVHVTRPGGRMAQVGDNDSGRFLKLLPPRDLSTLEEDFLDPRDSVAALNGLVRRADLAAFAGEPRVETELVRGLTGRAPAGAAPGDVARAERVRVGGEEAWSFLAEAPAGLAHATEFAAPGADLRDGARLFAYPDFGLYVFRSPRLFLAVRCGRRGQIATDGHAHLDELAVELTVDGRDVIADPGTYLYTALPARRNEYRSARAHFVPRRLAERADAALSGSLFELRGAPVGECLYWGPRGFVGRVVVDGAEVVRAVEVGAERVGVTDLVRSGGGWVEAGAPMVPEVPFSPGYGKRAVP